MPGSQVFQVCHSQAILPSLRHAHVKKLKDPFCCRPCQIHAPPPHGLLMVFTFQLHLPLPTLFHIICQRRTLLWPSCFLCGPPIMQYSRSSLYDLMRTVTYILYANLPRVQLNWKHLSKILQIFHAVNTFLAISTKYIPDHNPVHLSLYSYFPD